MTAIPSPAGRQAMTVRHEITGTLEAVTALRVGGSGTSAAACLATARDGLGRIVIPGSSLGGALRAWLGTVAAADGGCLFDAASLGRVFGSRDPRQGGDVCRIRVADAVGQGDVPVQVRDGAGIDRGIGAADAGTDFRLEVIPPGVRFAVRITAGQTHDDAERVGEALSLLVAGLAAGRVQIGAGGTRGPGRVRLTCIRRTRVDLTDRAQMLAWLCGRPPDASAVPLTADGSPHGCHAGKQR